MNLFKRSSIGFFASESLLGHLIRGGVAIGLLAWAIQHQTQTTLSILAGMGALIAFRGCPVCWTIGLIETVMQKAKRLIST
ncbi:MAG TPA: hypothetical protein VIF82_14765 [Burkholderiaceae bacterium]|jgi:hypothetical protein